MFKATYMFNSTKKFRQYDKKSKQAKNISKIYVIQM